MKAFVRYGQWYFTKKYVQYDDSKGNVRTHVTGLEFDFIRFVLQQMNMNFINVPSPKGLEMDVESVGNIIVAMISQKSYVVLGGLGINSLSVSYFEYTITHYMMTVRWYVPCSVKYPRWSSIFRILSVELWLVLIISIVIAAISTTLVGR